MNTDEKAVVKHEETAAVVSPRKALADKLRFMVVGGKKLTDEEIKALAQFAVVQDLNPFNQECYYLPRYGPYAGIVGIRKLALRQLRQLGQNESYSIKFIDVTKDLQAVRMKALEEPLKHYSKWFLVTLILVTLAIVVIIASVAGMLFGKIQTEVGIITSAVSLLITLFGGLLFKQLEKARKDDKENRSEIIKAYNQAISRIEAQAKEPT